MCRVAQMIPVSTVCGRRVLLNVAHVPRTQLVRHVWSLIMKGTLSFSVSSVKGLFFVIYSFT